MKNYLSIFARRVAMMTPQHAPIARTVPNSADGHAFPIDDWARLDRFLVLGSEGGSYYAGQAALTRDNAQAVLRAIAADGERAVSRIVAVSEDGRAPKNDSETWAGAIHPVEALRQYRERTGIAAKLVVVGLVSNGFSIADPNDAGMLDVVGFDTAAPAAIADFIRTP